jgi:PhnB protein
MQIKPFLYFNGRCEEAIEFYRGALGAEVTQVFRYKDSPAPAHGTGEKIMYASLKIGETTVLMSDGHSFDGPNFEGFSLSLTVTEEPEAERVFAALGDGGEERQALAKTFFSPRFGMVADRFGVLWMVYVE